MQAQGPRYNGFPLQGSPDSTYTLQQQQQQEQLQHQQQQLQHQQQRLHSLTDAADSDDGGQNSADDHDLDHDDDPHEVTRLGKRKRPISVS
jgi:hypothetical protein